jgi:hypothetical protein
MLPKWRCTCCGHSNRPSNSRRQPWPQPSNQTRQQQLRLGLHCLQPHLLLMHQVWTALLRRLLQRLPRMEPVVQPPWRWMEQEQHLLQRRKQRAAPQLMQLRLEQPRQPRPQSSSSSSRRRCLMALQPWRWTSQQQAVQQQHQQQPARLPSHLLSLGWRTCHCRFVQGPSWMLCRQRGVQRSSMRCRQALRWN